MGWFDWFYNILRRVGLLQKTATILLLGLDNAGKTTLLHRLADGRLSQHPPTNKPTMQELQMGGLKLQTFDLAGHDIARKIWRDYFVLAQAVVYIVDVNDHERLHESKKELNDLLSCEELARIPILILANKIDLPGALSEDQVRSFFELHNTTGKTTRVNPAEIRPVELFMCSIVRQFGYPDGLQWLAGYIN
eukprot:TRINITY_DN121_c1_g2_i1.p1 TRINITY_DN121_c1_g2~~TRINITY_DN121_c1_g2_i1.p1  ORF type:complete len:192 (-),score=97.92 TRINITY_DN121_c1_g2_i1:280-855(-)